MLRGISPLISPELLMILAEMGHGESILFADANFPAGKFCRHVIQAPGTEIPALLGGVMPLWTLDYKTQPLFMPKSNTECCNVGLSEKYLEIVRRSIPSAPAIEFLNGDEFYEQAKGVRACVVTGDLHRFANLIVRKGVFTPEYLTARET